MKEVQEQELNDQIRDTKISNLTVDDETGSFKLTLSDGRVLSLSHGSHKLSVALFPSEAEYSRRRQAYIARRNQRNEAIVATDEDEYDRVVGDMSHVPADVLQMLIGKLTEALVKSQSQSPSDTIH